MDIVLNKSGFVEYHPTFLSSKQSTEFLHSLKHDIDWQHDEIKLFGKSITTKRKVAWYADHPFEYIYSNSSKIAHPWTSTLQTIKAYLEEFTGEKFNSCLLNYYHNGSEAMGWHSDNEPSMKKNAPIASISLGAERDFIFRHNLTKDQCTIRLENGSLLMMKDETQAFWKHQLPARKRILAPRINLTFRQFIESTG